MNTDQLLLHGMVLLPSMVCALWATALLMDGIREGWRAAHGPLLAWIVAAGVLYGCHVAFFEQVGVTWSMAADVVYVACNLLVYPLYLMYLTVLTRGNAPRWLPIAVFTPPHCSCNGGRRALCRHGCVCALGLRAYLFI